MADITQIPEAKRGLHAAIAARQELINSNIPVDLGLPAGGPQKKHIWISGRVTDWLRVALTTGPSTGPGARLYEETFTLKVIVVCSWGSTSFDEALEQAVLMVTEIERAVMSDPTLGGALFDSEVAGGDISEGIAPDMRQVVPEINVRCVAHVSG